MLLLSKIVGEEKDFKNEMIPKLLVDINSELFLTVF